MKFTSTLVTLALGITLGNAAALPSSGNNLAVRGEDAPLPFEVEGVQEWSEEGEEDDSVEARDVNDDVEEWTEEGEEDGVETRAVKPKYNFKNFPKNGGRCAARQYSGGNVKDAGSEAGKLADRGKAIGTGKYPHQYNNRENVQFAAVCKGKTLEEFPILSNHKVFTGSENNPAVAPGADRVVVTVSKRDKKGNVDVTYCGMMTHEGAPVRNGFVACH